jgi:hypothetical protein
LKLGDKLVSLLVFLLFFSIEPVMAEAFPKNRPGSWKEKIPEVTGYKPAVHFEMLNRQ